MKTKQIIYLKALGIIALIALYVIGLTRISLKLYLYITILVFSLASIYPLFKIGKTYLKYFIEYMFCSRNDWWVKEIERPRLLFYIICVPFITLFFHEIISSFDSFGTGRANLLAFLSYQIILLSTITALFILLFSTWSKYFETTFIPKVQQTLNKKEGINSTVQPCKYEEVYKFLKEGIISGQEDTLRQFISYRGYFNDLSSTFFLKEKDKLEWICLEGLNHNQKYNSQTLISLISYLYGTENSTVITLINKTFFKSEYHITSKNISTWRNNNSKYLKSFEEQLNRIINDRKDK